MLKIKTISDTFQILGREEFSKRTAGKDVTMRKYEQSPCPLIKSLLFISKHKIEGRYWKS